MEEEKWINKGHVRAFLVCDKSFLEFDAPFVQWLREEGFKIGWCKGHYSNCPWMYIDITRKLYAYGMPGIAIVSVIGEHAITLDEFKMITKSTRVKKFLLFIKNGLIVMNKGNSSNHLESVICS